MVKREGVELVASRSKVDILTGLEVWNLLEADLEVESLHEAGEGGRRVDGECPFQEADERFVA